MIKRLWSITEVKDLSNIQGLFYDIENRFSTFLYYDDEEICYIRASSLYILNKKIEYLIKISLKDIKIRKS